MPLASSSLASSSSEGCAKRGGSLPWKCLKASVRQTVPGSDAPKRQPHARMGPARSSELATEEEAAQPEPQPPPPTAIGAYADALLPGRKADAAPADVEPQSRRDLDPLAIPPAHRQRMMPQRTKESLSHNQHSRRSRLAEGESPRFARAMSGSNNRS